MNLGGEVALDVLDFSISKFVLLYTTSSRIPSTLGNMEPVSSVFINQLLLKLF